MSMSRDQLKSIDAWACRMSTGRAVCIDSCHELTGELLTYYLRAVKD